MAVCVIQGTGDVGSAVAHLLFSHGHQVLLHDAPAPAHLRRGMAFVDACFDGSASLENVLGKRARDVADVRPMTTCRRAIPVTCDELRGLVKALRPRIVIDARMRKRASPEDARSADYYTIGLGPNFTAGGNVDVAIETAWGPSLGSVITNGETLPLEGEPRPLDGVGRERNVYSWRAGEFRTHHKIGQVVRQGEAVAILDEHFVTAPIGGCIRGLVHHGAHVEEGTKILEIDPRSDPAMCFGLGERPKKIAEGVLTAVNTVSP